MRSKPPPQGPARIASGSFAAVIRAFMSSEKFPQLLGIDARWLGTRTPARRAAGNAWRAISIHTIRPALVMAFLDVCGPPRQAARGIGCAEATGEMGHRP